MTDDRIAESIPINSITITERTRKDFGDIDSLAESINTVGLLQPIVINEDSKLMDGQRRILACTKLGISKIPFYRVSLRQIILGEFHANSNRKDFTTSERVAISYAVEKYLRENSRGVGRPRLSQKEDENAAKGKDDELPLDSNNTKTGKNNSVNLTTFSGRVSDNVSSYFGVSRNTLEKEKKIINAAEQNPEGFEELRKKVDKKQISVDKAFKRIQKQIKKAQILASVKNMTNNATDNITLLNGDFREQSKLIPNNSIDLIFTDPPYGSEYVPLYGDLAVIAYNMLKEGGSLVTYAGHYAIPKIITMMENAGLTYWWPIAVILSGSFAKHYPRQVTIKWKPLLWFVKGNKLCTTDFLSDVVKSDSPSKWSFKWEQSVVEAEHVISRLTIENQTVCDPMMGSGTTGVVALILGRKFVRIEIDSDKLKIANVRLGYVNNSYRTETRN